MIGRILAAGSAMALLLIPLEARAITEEEHASHHPGSSAPGMGSGGPAGAPVPESGGKSIVPDIPVGGMGAMMGMGMASPNPESGAAVGSGSSAGMDAMAGMMGQMMAPGSSGGCRGGRCGADAAQAPIYPTLMTLPALTPEKRAEIEALASRQIKDGAERLESGSASLHRATEADDHAAMQASIEQMREGLDVLGAGIAARRVLSEGKSPRNLALDWFKRDMNLATPIANREPLTLFGVGPFHFFTMALLIPFALAMLGLYFSKMRRAAALFRRVEPDSKPPPISGASGPSSAVASPNGNPPPPETPPLPKAPPAASGSNSAAPVVRNWRGLLRVGEIITETPNVKTFRLVPSSGDGSIPFTFEPGQFLNLVFAIGGAKMNRSYSISSSPTQRDHVDLTIRREPRGAVSRHVNDLLKVGDLIEAGGPVGKFTFTGTEADSIVLISGGVGITPMMSIARYLTERSWAGDVFFVYTSRSPEDIIFAREIAALQRANPKLHVAIAISRPEGTGWKGLRGRLSKDLLVQTVPNLSHRRIHLCGPPSMMESTKNMLSELGVPPAQVKTEAFGTVKPTPLAPRTTVRSTTPATGPLVTFSKSNRSARLHTDLQTGDSPPVQTILELSEELGIGIEFSCRVGTCGLCKVKLTSGEVEMDVQDGLDDYDRNLGMILACQAKPTVDVVVEA